MLSEYLKTQPIEPMLRDEGRNLFPPAEDRKSWEAISPEQREEIRALNAEYAAPYPMRTATESLRCWPAVLSRRRRLIRSSTGSGASQRKPAGSSARIT